MPNFESWYRSILAAKLAPADSTMTVATPPTVTSGRLYLNNWAQEERIKFTWVSGSTLTGLVRWLSKTADPATAGTGLSWIAGTEVKLVDMHDQLWDSTKTETITGQKTFTNAIFTGSSVIDTTGNLDVNGKSNPTPVFGSDAERDALYTAPVTNDRCYRTDLQAEQVYNGSSWDTYGIGTPTPLASESVAGKVQLNKAATWADVGSSWAALVPLMSDLSDRKTLTLWETIADGKVVSLLSDNKIYKQLGNKRTLSTGVTGHSVVTSVKLTDTKIITIWLTTNTITLYVWTIDLATNTIAYWAWTTVDTNAVSIRICKANTDKVFVMYWKTWTYTSIAWRVVDVSWTPSVGAETTLVSYHSTYSVTIWHCSYVASDKVVVTFGYPSGASTEDLKVLACTISWTTIGTVWTALQVVGNEGWNESFMIAYIADNRFCLIYDSWSWAGSVNVWLFSISWTTISALSAVWLSSWTHFSFWILYDGTYVYVSWTWYIHRCSISWDTISKDFSFSCTSSYICKVWKLIWLVSWTSLIRYSDAGSTLVQRNTIDYWISLANLFESVYSINYSIITVSWNPAPIYKIGNENRWIVGYLPTGAAKDATGTVIIEGGIITGLSNIIPGETYYVTYATGAIGLTGDAIFGKGISTTEIKIKISNVA